MVQKTETDYETVEKEIEVTYCDVCGMDYDDEEIAQIAINPETERMRHASANDYLTTLSTEGFNITHHPDMRRQISSRADPDDEDMTRHELARLRSEVYEVRSLLKQKSPVKLHSDGMLDVCRGCLETSLGVETIPTQETDFQAVERGVWTKSRVREGAKWLFLSSFGGTAEPRAMLLLAIFAISWAFVFAAIEVGFILLAVVPLIICVAAAFPLLFYIMETTL